MDSFFKRFGQVLKIKKSEYASQFRDLHWIMAYETSILRKLYTFKQNMSPTCTPPLKKLKQSSSGKRRGDRMTDNPIPVLIS